MRPEDLKTFADIGKAFWVDNQRSQRMTAETISAITLLDLTPDRAIERAAAALLERASRDGMAENTRANLGVIQQPFYRLAPEDRFLLVALHLGRWSYARLARIIEVSPEDIERKVWAARLQIVASAASLSGTRFVFPTGSGDGPSCPEYDKDRPWTQRFLDEEITQGRERLFLQNHLMACDACRQSLNRCRDVYYAVEKQIPRMAEADGFIRNLQTLCREATVIRNPSSVTFGESLKIFARRWDVQLGLSAAVVIFLYKLFR